MITDPRRFWWIFAPVQQRLVKWTLTLPQGRRYRILLEPEGTGCHAPNEKIIQANPQLFSTREAAVQFRATQGLLAHEVGHAWFTGCWPDLDTKRGYAAGTGQYLGRRAR